MSKSEEQVLNFEKICRLCLSEKRSMSAIFSKKKSDKKVPLPVRIMSCASLELYEGDGLPASICNKCLLSVNQSYAFREQCEQADTTLRQYAQQLSETNEESTMKKTISLEALSKVEDVDPEDSQKDLRSKAIDCCRDRAGWENWESLARGRVPSGGKAHGDVDLLEKLLSNKDVVVQKTSKETVVTDDEEKWLIIRRLSGRTAVGQEARASETTRRCLDAMTERKSKAPEDSLVFCKECNLFLKRTSFRGHNRFVHKKIRRFLCQTCGYATYTGTILRQHIQAVHVGYTFQCSKCPRKFNLMGRLRRHEEAQHSTDPEASSVRKNKICQHCGYAFVRLSSLKRHLLTHTGEKPEKCQFCDKRFKARWSVTQHEKVHTGVKPFKCQVCQKGFVQKRVMKNHEAKKLCDSVEDGFEETEINMEGTEEESQEDVEEDETFRTEEIEEADEQDGDGVTNMDEVEIEYLEEKYLTDTNDDDEEREDFGAVEGLPTGTPGDASQVEGEEHVLITSEGETTAVILPKGIKVEEAWEVDGEDLPFMLVGNDCEEVLEEVPEGGPDDGEDVVICNFCDKPVRGDAFEEHLRLIHTFKYCDLCKTEVKEKFFKAHMKSHEETKVFCELCNKLVRKQDFITHYKKHQGLDAVDKREKVNRKVCDICGYQVEGKGTLNKHMREKHDEGQNYCDLCEKYVWIKCYDKHIKDVHEDREDFCTTCQKWFKYYKTHMRTSHKDVVRFCDYCQVDVDAFGFDVHMATVHSKQSRLCETCNKEFFEFVCYKNHVRNIHLKVKSYKCSECDFTTAYRTSMDKHILGTHTRNQKYVCEICAKEFIVKDNLRKHIRMIHNGQQKSVCTYCGKVCHANRELINHVRLHTGDLPYQCEFCLRKFPKKWTLDNHRRIHTGEKPYKCTHCDSAFGTSAQMKIHEFREHGVEKYRHVDRAGKRRKMENIYGV